MTALESHKNIPNNVKEDFNEAIKLTNNYYKDQLLSIHNGQLIKVGPMDKDEALSFFHQSYKNTFPLYILELEKKYFAYY